MLVIVWESVPRGLEGLYAISPNEKRQVIRPKRRSDDNRSFSPDIDGLAVPCFWSVHHEGAFQDVLCGMIF